MFSFHAVARAVRPSPLPRAPLPARASTPSRNMLFLFFCFCLCRCVEEDLKPHAMAFSMLLAHLLGDIPSPPILGVLHIPF